ncbi:hypothetical protein DFP72DRAFT_848475 [Ephemerocybe angulata]|uniref:Uncharacterized protein n=1 Tax=Ephemerocybe angulata TaxID=980116 RepID=A0A8H6HXR5_9AGAR|nr:hypothetical protein DFP72DRAFT_848475 [Tulosesus angulatus]
MTPPPSNASGYHTQFRRGTLVPVHPTLHGQLGAIAKEYALPSTAGLVLYLVTSGTASGVQSPISPGMKSPMFDDDEMHEPGPRLSDDIWRHLWNRVVQAEQREGNMLPSRSPTPLTLSAHTPFLSRDYNGNLRPPQSPGLSPISPRPAYGFDRTPSPPSSISDLRSNSKSAPPSSASAQSDFDANTPDTSINGHAMRADSLDLPGLNSPSLIPILAKVEFDIDRRKAGWYEPWIRSRKANHAKRSRSRKSSNVTEAEEEGSKEKERVPAIPLLIGRKETSSPLGMESSDPSKVSGTEEFEEDSSLAAAGYEQLSDTQEADSDSDNDDNDLDDFAEDTTARVSSIVDKQDPLEDVFGSDADTWSDMKGERRTTHEFNPEVVNLALTPSELDEEMFNSQEQDENDTSRYTTKEEEEVRELLDRMSQSGNTTPDLFASFSPESLSKKIPPPLVLVPNSGPQNVVAAEPSPYPTAATTGAKLAYLDSPDNQSDLDADENIEYRSKSPSADSEKRSGALFEDLDLGLDPTDDYDYDDDVNDRRKSQIVMSAQLDEIERTLAQLSPRILNNNDLEEEQNQSFRSMSTLSPNSPSKLTLSPLRGSDLISPRLPQHRDPPGDSPAGASWPAVPFSMIKDASRTPAPPSNSGTRPPSPPQLALNGVTTAAPRSFNPRGPGDEMSSETHQRRKELEEEQAFFRKPPTQSPVIPLSADPFGRFSSSTPEVPPSVSESDWDTTTLGRSSISLGDGEKRTSQRMGRARSGTTSRFSIDSVVEEEGPAVVAAATKPNRGTLMSVKSIKNLWRKSNKGDKDKDKAEKAEKGSGAASLSSGRVSPAPQRPERPSHETMDLPDVPPIPPSGSFGRISPQPPVDMSRRPSQSSQSSRPSLDYPSGYPSPELPPPRRSQDAPPPMMAPGLSVPPYANIATRNNSSPIIPAQMLPNRPGNSIANMRFDQESPYPNPVRNNSGARYTQRPPSPPQPSPPPPQQHQGSQFSLPPIPEQEKLARKSILKWKSSSSNGSHHYPQDQPPGQRMSFDRASNSSGRTNGSGSGSSHGHGKASINSFSSDLAPPPSPMMPDHFNGHAGHPGSRVPSFTSSSGGSSSYEAGGPLRSRTPETFSSSTSPPMHFHQPRAASPAASFTSSQSIDESQFEIVSPKLNGGFAYPNLPYSGNLGAS